MLLPPPLHWYSMMLCIESVLCKDQLLTYCYLHLPEQLQTYVVHMCFNEAHSSEHALAWYEEA